MEACEHAKNTITEFTQRMLSEIEKFHRTKKNRNF
jgi:hypothetical protein